jgi:hypothetical protein
MNLFVFHIIRSSTIPLHVVALSPDPSLQNTMVYVTFTCGGTFIWPIITEYKVLRYLYMWQHFHLTHHYRIRCSTVPLHVAALSSDPSIHNTMSTVPLHVAALSSDPLLQNTKFYCTFTCGDTFIWPIITEYDVLRYLYMWRHFHLTHQYIIRSSTLPFHVAALVSDPLLQNTMFYCTFTCGGTFIWPIITEYKVLLYLYMWRHFHLTHHCSFHSHYTDI